MVKYILVRHGQTEWNKSERFRGQADIPLNDTGKEQARKVAAYLANDKIDAVYCSPLSRARHTAEPFAKDHHLEIQLNDGLTDIDVGALEGLTVEEARQAFPDVVTKWQEAPGHVRFPKGDSVKSLQARLNKLLAEIEQRHEGQTIALVSHRVVCHALMCIILGLDLDRLWRIRQDNACIDRFETSPSGYVLTLLNETSHLNRS